MGRIASLLWGYLLTRHRLRLRGFAYLKGGFMKSVLGLVFAAVLLSFSPAGEATVMSQNLSSCAFSTMIRSADGQIAYACGSYPMQVQVADYYSTASDIQALQLKIMDLERRIKILEAKP
jgi:hypothetical protein